MFKNELNNAYVGLGSNLSDPLTQVRQALQELETLPATKVVKQSSLYRSEPLGVPHQPDYINAVALLRTALTPQTLLTHLQHIEQQHGRIRSTQRWIPRTLDLDLLLYGNIQSADPFLTLPHPQLENRNFVLYPLFECTPELVLPDGQRLADLLPRCPQTGLDRINDS